MMMMTAMMLMLMMMMMRMMMVMVSTMMLMMMMMMGTAEEPTVAGPATSDVKDEQGAGNGNDENLHGDDEDEASGRSEDCCQSCVWVCVCV